jgi:hypothetical protein
MAAIFADSANDKKSYGWPVIGNADSQGNQDGRGSRSVSK